jgi:hypothetical protein
MTDIPTHDAGGVRRRTLVKGAAWSVPVIAVAVATPLAAASEARQLSFTNGPYQINACADLAPMRIVVSSGGVPVGAGEPVQVTLPSGLTWSDGSSGARAYTTGADGSVTTDAVSATPGGGTFAVTAVSGAATNSAPVNVTALPEHGGTFRIDSAGAITQLARTPGIVSLASAQEVYGFNGSGELFNLTDGTRLANATDGTALGPVQAIDSYINTDGTRFSVFSTPTGTYRINHTTKTIVLLSSTPGIVQISGVEPGYGINSSGQMYNLTSGGAPFASGVTAIDSYINTDGTRYTVFATGTQIRRINHSNLVVSTVSNTPGIVKLSAAQEMYGFNGAGQLVNLADGSLIVTSTDGFALGSGLAIDSYINTDGSRFTVFSTSNGVFRINHSALTVTRLSTTPGITNLAASQEPRGFNASGELFNLLTGQKIETGDNVTAIDSYINTDNTRYTLFSTEVTAC